MIGLENVYTFRWITMDLDYPGAYYAAEDANLPAPNYIAMNRAGGHGRYGHAHASWLLKTAVKNFAGSRKSPLHYFAAVQRGMRRWLNADRGFKGVITKNPLHPDWNVEWRAPNPYDLVELADWLFDNDMRPEPRSDLEIGAGRNCTIFDEVRRVAYSEVVKFKKHGGSPEQWQNRCIELAARSNLQYQASPRGPLRAAETRAIGKSIAKWTWAKFSTEAFSRRQSLRGSRSAAKRWDGLHFH